MEKQIDWVLDMRTYLLRDQHDLKANVAALDPRRQSQEEYVRKRKSYQHHWSVNFCGLQEDYIYLKEIYSEFNDSTVLAHVHSYVNFKLSGLVTHHKVKF